MTSISFCQPPDFVAAAATGSDSCVGFASCSGSLGSDCFVSNWFEGFSLRRCSLVAACHSRTFESHLRTLLMALYL